MHFSSSSKRKRETCLGGLTASEPKGLLDGQRFAIVGHPSILSVGDFGEKIGDASVCILSCRGATGVTQAFGLTGAPWKAELTWVEPYFLPFLWEAKGRGEWCLKVTEWNGLQLSRPQFMFWLASCLLHLNYSQISLLRKEGARALEGDDGFVVWPQKLVSY